MASFRILTPAGINFHPALPLWLISQQYEDGISLKRILTPDSTAIEPNRYCYSRVNTIALIGHLTVIIAASFLHFN